MKILPLSEAKARLSKLVSTIGATDERIVITRNGRPAAVLISPDEFDSWSETVKIRSNPSLMRDIKKGLKSLKGKGAKTYKIDELFG